jgi:MFS transporter, DHA1 family, tetracycline resistance protein
MPQPRKAAFAFIIVTVVLDMLALGIIIPVLPKLVEHMMGGNTSRAAAIYGWFGFTWAMMQFFCSPIIGALSDRFGRRPVILMSNLGLGLDYIVMAVAGGIPWLLIGRAISGMFAASISTAYAYIADVTPPEQRAQRFGMLGAAFGLGFIIGPAIGGLLGGADPRLPFWVAAALSLANAAYGYFVLPESLPKEKRDVFRWSRANPFASLKLLRSHAELFGLAGVGFLMNFAHFVLPSTMVLYAGYRYGWDTEAVGFFLMGVGACSAIVQGGLVRPMVARYGQRHTLLMGLVFGAIGFAIYGLAPNGALMLLGVPVMALWGMSGPALQAMMTERLGPSEQGKLQGANMSLMGIAGMIGPLLFTNTFAQAIGPHRDWHLPGAPLLLAAMLMVIATILAWNVARPMRIVEIAPQL